jgi:hypothetical protein
MRLNKNFLPYSGLIGKYFGSKICQQRASFSKMPAKIFPGQSLIGENFCLLLTDRESRNTISKARIRQTKNSCHFRAEPGSETMNLLTKMKGSVIISTFLVVKLPTKTCERFFHFTLNQNKKPVLNKMFSLPKHIYPAPELEIKHHYQGSWGDLWGNRSMLKKFSHHRRNLVIDDEIRSSMNEFGQV